MTILPIPKLQIENNNGIAKTIVIKNLLFNLQTLISIKNLKNNSKILQNSSQKQFSQHRNHPNSQQKQKQIISQFIQLLNQFNSPFNLQPRQNFPTNKHLIKRMLGNQIKINIFENQHQFQESPTLVNKNQETCQE